MDRGLTVRGISIADGDRRGLSGGRRVGDAGERFNLAGDGVPFSFQALADVVPVLAGQGLLADGKPLAETVEDTRSLLFAPDFPGRIRRLVHLPDTAQIVRRQELPEADFLLRNGRELVVDGYYFLDTGRSDFRRDAGPVNDADIPAPCNRNRNPLTGTDF